MLKQGRRLGSVAMAMLALAVQILLCPGHTHAQQQGSQTAAAPAHSDAAGPTLPFSPRHEDDCPACWCIGLASAALAATPLVLARPARLKGPRTDPQAEAVPAAGVHLNFQARGPPRPA